MALNWADYAIIITILLSIVISLVRGFVREAMSLASWILALWVGITFSPALASLLEAFIKPPPLRMVVAFFILFAITLILGAIINFVICQFVKKTGLSGTDRMLGMVFGLGRGVILVALLLLVGGLSSLDNDSWWTTSVLIPKFSGMVTWIQGFLPDTLTVRGTT